MLEYESPDYSYKTMRQWVKEGRIRDLHRLYDDPYGNPGPTKIPAGRIELTFDQQAVFKDASLDLAKATTEIRICKRAPSRRFSCMPPSRWA